MLEPIKVVPVPGMSFDGRRLCIEIFPADDAVGLGKQIAEEVGARIRGLADGSVVYTGQPMNMLPSDDLQNKVKKIGSRTID